MQQDTMQFDAPAAITPEPTGVTLITLGGSHRALARAGRTLDRAGIPYRSLGPTDLGSSRILFAIPVRCLEQARGLGIGAAKAKNRMEWLDRETEQSYFGGKA